MIIFFKKNILFNLKIFLENYMLKKLLNQKQLIVYYKYFFIKISKPNSMLNFNCFLNIISKRYFRLALQLMANFLGHPEGRECIPRVPNDFLDVFTR